MTVRFLIDLKSFKIYVMPYIHRSLDTLAVNTLTSECKRFFVEPVHLRSSEIIGILAKRSHNIGRSITGKADILLYNEAFGTVNIYCIGNNLVAKIFKAHRTKLRFMLKGISPCGAGLRKI